MDDDADDREQSVVRRQFDPDDVLEHAFSDPPAPEARTEIAFTYEGYRISVYRDGTAEFAKVT